MNKIENKLIEIFCDIDDFNKVFISELQTHQLSDGGRKRIKPSTLSESEVMTIVTYFHIMQSAPTLDRFSENSMPGCLYRHIIH